MPPLDTVDSDGEPLDDTPALEPVSVSAVDTIANNDQTVADVTHDAEAVQEPPPSQPISKFISHVIRKAISDSSLDSPRGMAPNPFTLENWPVTGLWKEELLAVKDTHMISPLPAYGIDLQPIKPRDYHRSLVGAIVEVHCTLAHYMFTKEGRSTLVANIEELNVLVPPPSLPTSPSKRKFMDRAMGNLPVDFPESPTKKGKKSIN